MELSIEVKAKEVVTCVTNWTNFKRDAFDPSNSQGENYSNSVKFYYTSFCNNLIMIIGCIKINLFVNIVSCFVVLKKGACVRKAAIFERQRNISCLNYWRCLSLLLEAIFSTYLFQIEL